MQVTPVRAFSDNYIWMLVDGDKAVATDPGDAAPVRDFLQQQNLRLETILVTHHHFDHTGGVEELKAATGAKVYGPGGSNIRGLDSVMAENDSLEVLGRRFEVIAVPGHTLDHIAYYCPDEQVLLCGDTLFSAGCGRLFEGSAEQMHSSLSKLAALPDATSVYCTHEYTQSNLRFALAAEPDNADAQAHAAKVDGLRQQDKESLPSSIALEKRINPFLRAAVPSVRSGAESWAGKALGTEVQVLAALRRWKDSF